MPELRNGGPLLPPRVTFDEVIGGEPFERYDAMVERVLEANEAALRRRAPPLPQRPLEVLGMGDRYEQLRRALRERETRESSMDNSVKWSAFPVIAFDETIGTLFGKKGFQKTKEEFIVGVELEQETKDSFDLPELKGWAQHREGSLRDFGFEYVLSPPLPERGAIAKIEALFEKLPVSKFSNSLRTSVHVHIDVTKYSFKEVATFACVYWLCEPLLLALAGANRKGNLFCLQSSESNFLQKGVAGALEEGNVLGGRSGLYSENYRYASLNFSSIPKFGSIETRVMRGTGDIEEIRLWLRMLRLMKEYGLRFSNPYDLLMHFFSKEYKAESLYQDVFGEEVLKALEKYTKGNYKQLVQDTRSIASSLFVILKARSNYDLSKEKAEAEAKFEEQEKAREEAARLAALRNTLLGERWRATMYAEEDNRDNVLEENAVIMQGDF